MMATRQVDFQRSDSIKLGDEFESGYMALANKKAITESGHLLLANFGDQLERKRNICLTRVQGRSHRGTNLRRNQPGSSPLRSIVNVVDTVLEWLEHSGKNAITSLKKQETVLRGVFHLIDLANQSSSFAVLELASSFLDVVDDPFRVQRDFILECLKDIKEQKERIQQLVNDAGEILNEIIDNETDVDKLKGRQFDNIVRKAHVQIGSCRRRLESAEEKINELSTKMNILKWFSRAARCTGWGITTYCFYQKFKESTYAVPLVFGCSSIAGAIWLSLFPSRAYGFYESISKLASTHSLLTERLEDLREKLSSAKDYKDGLMKDVGDPV